MNLENSFFVFSSLTRKLVLVLLFAFSTLSVVDCSEKPLVIVATSYKNKRWAKKNLTSIFAQKYSNYRVIYVDDCSPDGTADIVEEFVHHMKQDFRFKLIRNKERRGTLANIYEAIHSCSDEEIVVSVDGDDWLENDLVLEKLNQVYSRGDIWLTHGTLKEFPNNSTSWCIPIPQHIIDRNLFRTYRCPSHLEDFYAWLFKKIDVNDLMYNGNFFQMTGDQAMMFPMVEMAGKHHAFISDILYVYNVENPINDNKVDPNLQNKLEKYIRSMPPYKALDGGLLK